MSLRIPDRYSLPPEDFPITRNMDPWRQGAGPWSRSPAERNQLAVPPVPKPKAWTAGAGGWERQEPPPQWVPGPPQNQLQDVATSSRSAPPLGGAQPKTPPPEIGPPPQVRLFEEVVEDPDERSWGLLHGPRSPSR